jgi:two-component system OmpR family response regulator
VAEKSALRSVSIAEEAHPRILLVEDDPEISRIVIESLSESGFAATFAKSAADMDYILARQDVDLVILDIMLPGEDGLSICRRLRASSKMPIIMMTALTEEIDRVVGLEIGADDYISKPFSSRELIARIRALLRRTVTEESASRSKCETLAFLGWTIDPATRRLRDPKGVKVQLTSTEFDFLLAFCRNPNRILSREQLLELTHSGLAGPIERSVDVHISRIRQKIEADPTEPDLIKTVRLGGYIFTAAVEPR